MFDNLNEALKFRQGYNGNYILGKVKVNLDPIRKDRIKVEAAGLYDPGQGDVPWVGILKWSPFGISKDWGVYGSPAVGSDVAMEFQEGSPDYPLYHSIQREKPPAEFDKDKVWGFKDPKGNWVRFDLESGEAVVNLKSGFVFTLNPDGTLKIEVKGDTTVKMPTLYLNANVRHTGTFRSNGVNIGSDHIHGQVESGNSTSGVPAN